MKKVILTHYAVYFEDGQLLDTSVLEIAEKFNMVNIHVKTQMATRQLKQGWTKRHDDFWV